MPSSVSSSAGGRKRIERKSPPCELSAGRSPGKNAISVVPSKCRPSVHSPGTAVPTIEGRPPPSPRTSASRVARTAASAMTSTSAPASPAPAVAAQQPAPPAATTNKDAPGSSRDNPFSARLVSSTQLTHPEAPKDTRHVVIDLLDAGLTADEVVALHLEDVLDTSNASGLRLQIGGQTRLLRGGAPLAQAYLERRARVGLDAGTGTRLITDRDGQPIAADALSEYLQCGRRQRISMTFNAVMCKGLLETRYDLHGGR